MVISDLHVKKKMSIQIKEINLENNFNMCSFSSFNLAEIEYIKHKNKIICVLSEKILSILKNKLILNSKIYSDILTTIFSHRYTHNNNKIIMSINFKNDDELPKFKIIDEYGSFTSILSKYDNKKKLKKFIRENA